MEITIGSSLIIPLVMEEMLFEEIVDGWMDDERMDDGSSTTQDHKCSPGAYGPGKLK